MFTNVGARVKECTAERAHLWIRPFSYTHAFKI